MEHKVPSRNPAGIEKDKPIALRLMPDERKAALAMSKVKGQSGSSFARMCYLAGFNLLFGQRKTRRSNGKTASPSSSCAS